MSTSKKPVPETVLKYRKRVEAWSAEKAAKEKETAKRIEEKKKIVFKRAEEYVKEYRQQASMTSASSHAAINSLSSQEDDLRRMARVARIEKGFYVPPEPKLAFVIRIKGINKMHPKVRRTDLG